jgi:hypothetical protein
VRTSSFWACDGGAWRRNLLEGVMFGVPLLVLVVVVLAGGAAGSASGLCCSLGAEGPWAWSS